MTPLLFINKFIEELELPLSEPVLVFSIVLLIIFFAPLLRKINLPGIVGLIAAGVVIGPKGLNIVEMNAAVELFSTIGLLYIMFIAGLELDMNQFKATRHRSLMFGLFTFSLPLLIGYPACRYLLGYDFYASFLTASMFSTHTLIAYPIVSRLGVSKDESVAVTVGGTILTDTAVLIVLAVIVGSASGNLEGGLGLRLFISLSVFLLIMFFAVPRIARFFFRKMEREKYAHYIFVLAVMFLSAFLAELAGVEPIIGAFMAGLALNRQIPASSPLMNRIEFMGNALFIPFFLIGVGMLVDLSVVFSGFAAWVIAITLTVVAVFGKWLAATFTQLAFGYSGIQRNVIFGLSSSHAAATLAVILVGYQEKILDANILNGTIILILITCIIASVVTEKNARFLALKKDKPADGNRYDSKEEHILLPVAKLENVYKLLDLTFIIRDLESVHPLTLLSIVPNSLNVDKKVRDTKEELNKFTVEAAAGDMLVQVMAVVDFSPASGIARVSREIAANFIIMGWPEIRRDQNIVSIGSKRVSNIIDLGDKNVLIAKLTRPLSSFQRIDVFVPPLSEKEIGFEFWIIKMAKLSMELCRPLYFHGVMKTYDALIKVLKYYELAVVFRYEEFDGWDTMANREDLFFDSGLAVIILARKGGVSYQSVFEHLPTSVHQKNPDMDKIVIYPQEYSDEERASAPL